MIIKYIIQSSLTCNSAADILVPTYTTTKLYITEAKVDEYKYNILIVTLYILKKISNNCFTLL